MARDFGLEVADKPDSQDICFVPTGRYSDLVARLRPEALSAGDIVHLDGRILGRHRGIAHYTVGQRRGLGLADTPGIGGEPLFVVKLDAARGRVVVGPRQALETAAVRLRAVNWIGPGTLAAAAQGLEVAVRLRSTRPPLPARLRTQEGAIHVDLSHHEQGVSPGQACVIYASQADDAQVYGGGIIAATAPAAPIEARDVALA